MIWVLGGGLETYTVCQQLKTSEINYKLTIMMNYAKDMPLSYSSLKISKPFTLEEMKEYIIKNNIQSILDITHNQAMMISNVAIEASKQCQILYMRYIGGSQTKCYSLNDVVKEFTLSNEKALLHVDRKSLSYLKDHLKNYYVGCKENSRLIETCKKLQIKEKHIMVFNSCNTIEDYIRLLKEYKISHVILKKKFITQELNQLGEKNIVRVMPLEDRSFEYPNTVMTIQDIKSLIK